MTPEQAREFLAEHHRAVMITRRQSGGLQTSPVVVAAADDGSVLVSSRETAYKVRNLRRDPRVTLCVFTDAFFGRWLQIDGTAEIRSLPEAMDGLVDYYRRVAGEHPDWAEYREAMQKEQRVLVRVAVERVGPSKSG
jgi:PPOX class probable F420-dependent enzyme